MCLCCGLIFIHIFPSAKPQQLLSPMLPVAHMRLPGHVTSQTSVCPHFHGAIVTPSGHLSSEHDRPAGSRKAILSLNNNFFYTLDVMYFAYNAESKDVAAL